MTGPSWLILKSTHVCRKGEWQVGSAKWFKFLPVGNLSKPGDNHIAASEIVP